MDQLIKKVIEAIKEVFPTKQDVLNWKSKCKNEASFCFLFDQYKKDTVIVVPIPPCKNKKVEGLILPKQYEEERKLEEQSGAVSNFKIGVIPYYSKDVISSFVLYAPYGNIILSEDCHIVHKSNIYMELVDNKLYELAYGTDKPTNQGKFTGEF